MRSVKKRIFLTGGTGFIGRNILERLSGKYHFIAPPHQELNLEDFERVELTLRKLRPDVVIHAANVGGNRKMKSTPSIAVSNLKMFFNLVRCSKNFKKMIHLGSGVEFGKEKPLVGVKEIDFDKKVPLDLFGFFKYVCAKYIEQSEKIINLRLFGIWGKYEDYEIRFISNAICKSILGMPITINQNVFFDYLHIDDFIEILDYFINHGVTHKTYNVGRGEKIDLLTIAKKINKLAPTKSKIIVRHKGLGNEYTCNDERLLKELGGFKFTSFDNSLEKLYQWYLSISHTFRKQSFLDDHF